MFFNKTTTIAASESGLHDRFAAASHLNEPIEIRLAPTIAGKAIKSEPVVLPAQVLKC